MIDSTFINTKSFLAKIDPRVRIIFCFLYAVVVAMLKNKIAVYVALILPCFLLFTNAINFFKLFKRLATVNGFVLLLWVFLPFTYPGEPMFHISNITASKEGVEYAYLITLKSNAIVITTIFLLGISSFIQIAHALAHLKVPDKLIFLLFFCYRYIYDISEQYKKLRNSLKIRGFSPKTNLFTYKIYGYLIGMLLIKSYDRAQRVINAMICRGFNGTFYMLEHFHYKKSDTPVLISGLLYISFILGVNYWMHL